MKQCPSCNAECEDAAEVCPSCGYQYEAEPDDDNGRKRTMMGFPSLDSGIEDAEDEDEAEPVKNTLFGFPALDGDDGDGREAAPSEASDYDEPAEDSGEYAATHVLSPSEFDFDDDLDLAEGDDEDSPADGTSASHATDDSPPETAPDDEDDDADDALRGTVAGMPLEEGDGQEEEAKTEIVPGTAVFPGNQADADDDEGADDIRNKGTLMGMSLREAAKRAVEKASAEEDEDDDRSTQFAIPAVQRGQDKVDTMEGVPTASEAEEDSEPQLEEESEEPVDDAPTQAWNPGSLGLKDKADPDEGRKKLLEKIRKSRPSARDTAKGVPAAKSKSTKRGVAVESPDLSALRSLRPKRGLKSPPPNGPETKEEDQRETNERPKIPRGAVRERNSAGGESEKERPTNSTVRANPIPSERTSKLKDGAAPGGVGSYLMGRDSSSTRKGAAIGSLSPRQQQETDDAAEKPGGERGTGDSEAGLAPSDPEFGLAETGVADGDLVEQADFEDGAPAGPAPARSPQMDSDTSVPGSPNPTHANGEFSRPAPQARTGEAPPPERTPQRSDQIASGPQQLGQQRRQSSSAERQVLSGHQQFGSGREQAPSEQQRSPSGQQKLGGSDAGQPGQPAEPSPRRQPAPSGEQPAGRGPAAQSAPGVYDTFDGGSPSGPGQARASAGATGKQTEQPAPDPQDDPLVRRIQTMFGILGGFIVLIVQVFLFDNNVSTPAMLAIAFGFMLGVGAIATSFAPVKSSLRSLGLFGIVALLVGAIVAGIVVSLPVMILVVGLGIGAFACFMAATFPYVARFLL